mmetsp:Transcript_33021/g.78465  ORF Transcript_33021/g.78465 Transcript_33021/m.78465 type:complete len:206 (-) Transcript_33021:337-954(-)
MSESPSHQTRTRVIASAVALTAGKVDSSCWYVMTYSTVPMPVSTTGVHSGSSDCKRTITAAPMITSSCRALSCREMRGACCCAFLSAGSARSLVYASAPKVLVASLFGGHADAETSPEAGDVPSGSDISTSGLASVASTGRAAMVPPRSAAGATEATTLGSHWSAFTSRSALRAASPVMCVARMRSQVLEKSCRCPLPLVVDLDA